MFPRRSARNQQGQGQAAHEGAMPARQNEVPEERQGENGQDEEVSRHENTGDNREPEGSQMNIPPPPPMNDLVQVMANQTRLLEALTRAINDRPRNRGAGVQEKMSEFIRIKPPTFAGSENPLEADDWLRVIQRKLDTIHCEGRDRVLLASHQLTGSALAWWENYCVAADDAATITWEEFTDEFRRYHIPEGTMRLKADEFRNLKQGTKTVNEYIHQFIELSRYAPEEVNTDMKKQNLFKKGLNAELSTTQSTPNNQNTCVRYQMSPGMFEGKDHSKWGSVPSGPGSTKVQRDRCNPRNGLAKPT